jgi:hypothetical protein
MIAVVIRMTIIITETAKTGLFRLQANHKYGPVPFRPWLLVGVLYDNPIAIGVWKYPLQGDVPR